jgi:hypothetical protein
VATTKTFPSFNTNTTPASGDYLVGYYADGSQEFKATLDKVSPYIRGLTNPRSITTSDIYLENVIDGSRDYSVISGGYCNTISGDYLIAMIDSVCVIVHQKDEKKILS